ncbi:Lipid A core - O-antigen ligase and related enzymes [Rhodococcus gordoniae]|uniref:Lipid A core - O-antigen ligase and related enzymes n=1 Tax=Rhodococcus gordoniae TaxID=223392 RepID=A0A379M1I3_9NOCA|nr:O-antigen ligase family protein [Rhodococcus gordoniae]SUE15388.1 Lipid A core - O-antigen ligase and related enzymes [Rhodococcus gordoniae]
MTTPILILGGLVCVFAIPVIPIRPLIIGLVVLRSLADYGIATGNRPALLSSLTLAVSFISIYALVVHIANRQGSFRWMRFGFPGVMIVLFWTAVGFGRYGIDGDLILESMRLLSALSIFILAYAYCRPNLPRTTILWMIAPAAVVALASALTTIEGTFTRAGRLTATFSHPNAAGAFFGLSVVVLLAIWLKKRDRITFSICLAAGICLLLTGSLGGIVGCIVGVLVVVWTRPARSSGRRILQSLAVAAVLAAGYIMSGLSARVAEFNWGAQSASKSDADSFQWRFENWRRLIDEWQENPLLGYGLGASSHNVMPMGGPPHSLYFQVMVDMGAVGVLLLVVGAVAMSKHARKVAKVPGWEGAALLGILSFALVNGLVSNLVGYTATIYLMAAVTGFILAYVRQRNVPDSPCGALARNDMERAPVRKS